MGREEVSPPASAHLEATVKLDRQKLELVNDNLENGSFMMFWGVKIMINITNGMLFCCFKKFTPGHGTKGLIVIELKLT